MLTAQARWTIPVPCPNCAAVMHLPDDSLVGRHARCWSCRHKFLIEIGPGRVASRNSRVDVPVEENATADAPTGDDSGVDLLHAESQETLCQPMVESGVPPVEFPELPQPSARDATASASAPNRVSHKVTALPPSRPIPCVYCQSQMLYAATALISEGCAVCGAHFAPLAVESVAAQPEWATRQANLELMEVRHGAHGVLYRARRRDTGAACTVRVPPADCWETRFAKTSLSRLWKARAVRHRRLFQIDEICVDGDGVRLIGPETVATSLADWMLRNRMTPADAAGFCADVAEAVHAAHAQDIVHRDLKPANIFIDSQSRPLIFDLGCPRTRTGGGTLLAGGQPVTGTVAYMAPEQARGHEDAHPKEDVYSIGVLLYHLVVGQLPFRGRLADVLNAIQQSTVPLLSKSRDGVPWEFDVIAKRCLSKDPKQRYDSAEELAHDLRRLAMAK